MQDLVIAFRHVDLSRLDNTAIFFAGDDFHLLPGPNARVEYVVVCSDSCVARISGGPSITLYPAPVFTTPIARPIFIAGSLKAMQ
jgi:hypothetical protein